MAESYERRRPGYRPELVDWLVAKLGLGRGTTVVDLAAGTGKLTRQLVPTGARVVAIEPLDEMRVQLEAAVPEAEALAGTAEELPLPDATAEAITIAAAIHWLDLDRALPELHRVLKPGGHLGVVGQGRDLRDRLQQEIQELLGRYLPDHSEFGHWRDQVAASGLFAEPETFQTTFEQWFDAEGLAERIDTISHVARLPDDVRARIHEQVRALGEAQPETPFAFRYRTEATVYRRREADYPLGR